MQTIYFDESGFTGNDLLNEDQPFFVYTSIAVSPVEAKDISDRLVKDFGLNGNEIKGRKILSHTRGIKAASYLVKNHSHQVKAVIIDKKYALAGKFFEHLFEPALAEQNSIFYGIGFHRFISTLIYLEFIARPYAREMLTSLQSLLRTKDLAHFNDLLALHKRPEVSDALKQVLEFAVHHRKHISKEIAVLNYPDLLSKWVLDLTITALFSSLTTWGEKFESLDVYCDNSKPLEAEPDLFNMMIGRKDKEYMEINGEKTLFTFNLAHQIQLADSKITPGIQLADVFSGIFMNIYKDPKSSQNKEWLNVLINSIDKGTVLPDYGELNMKNRKTFVNSVVLCEIVDRSREGRNLFEGIPQIIRMAQQAFDKGEVGFLE